MQMISISAHSPTQAPVANPTMLSRRIQVLLTASIWPHPSLAPSWKTLSGAFTIVMRPITCMGAVGYVSMLAFAWAALFIQACYIFEILRPCISTLIRVLRNPSFQQHNATTACCWFPLRTSFFDAEMFRLAFTIYLANENFWSIVWPELLARQHKPVTAVEELWHRVEAA
ncbi:hypothetical protein TNCV_4077531 [Trichonephila clavipes]|nr:hypothetical protein TNCV_4077531 [Trichonephila clavipes]